MCGIVGLVSNSGPLHDTLEHAAPAMLHALVHRGPDGGGLFRDGAAVLGHRRLAIIDRGSGAQPLSNEDGSCWIVFNGEIYNHVELRRELTALGHVFRTRCDTEAIVHAYEQFGSACVDRLEGMFAFAIWDRRTRELFIARDRLGKKPLFYMTAGGAFHFASEIKALRRSPAWNGDIDRQQLEAYFCLGYALAPHTVYRGVRELAPGHWVRVRAGSIEDRRYWDIPRFDDFGGSEREALDTIQRELEMRVGERLESEVPLGAFLSGGIDSGLVVASMSKLMSTPVVTVSVGFAEAAHNELSGAKHTAHRFGTAHHEHVIEPRLEHVLGQIVAAFDQPFADASAVPTFYVSREARRHVTVALSGDGGDEAFGGYTFRYIPHAREARIRGILPGAARRALASMGARWPRSRRIPRVLRWGTYLENMGYDDATAYYADLCFVSLRDTLRILGRPSDAGREHSATFATVTDVYRSCPSADPVQKAEFADLKLYLSNDVLTKVDRMSMQHSLEVRCPLLDRRLIELAFRLPQSIKQAGTKGKHLLKSIAGHELPPDIVRGGKHGFTAPISEWIAGPYAQMYQDLVLSRNSPVEGLTDTKHLRALFSAHRSRRADHTQILWASWMLACWAAATGEGIGGQPPSAGWPAAMNRTSDSAECVFIP